ncbi:hypothetical protein BHE74_00010736 [Ensete ventricosum]|nr:hypothetical protein BHE74_00010736 [Ensete ventricosum]RZR78102.1 hypothetical protein BHM03_00003349 [Ensete ventricosum]
MTSACGNAEGVRDCCEDVEEVLNIERLTRWKVALLRATVIGKAMATMVAELQPSPYVGRKQMVALRVRQVGLYAIKDWDAMAMKQEGSDDDGG